MSKTSHRYSRTAVVAFTLLLAAGLGAGLEAQSPEKVSRFGEYKGYSAPVYDSWVRTSRYLTMRDGVRLAADIIRPALKGKVEEKPLPATFIHTRYRRAAVNKEGKVESEADEPLGQFFLKHGYVVMSVDVRGSGASFGAWPGLFSPDETRDAYEIIEWAAAQPWCDGKIGMSGGSYLGTTQLMAASTRPPHLKALFPAVPLFDVYAVDYTRTTGTTTRWDNAVGGGFAYPDMTVNDGKGLTYTTAPLSKDVEVTGHPVVHLWVSSTGDDADVFAYLEEVDASGVFHYVTEGTIKASYRALGEAPYDYLGLPFHRSYKEDAATLKPGGPMELVFDMEPTSNVFDAGNRIRLTITGADKDNAEVKDVSPAPKVTLYRDKARASRITLPIVGGMAGEESATAGQKAKAGSLMTYVLFVVFLVLVLVIAFTYYMKRRMK